MLKAPAHRPEIRKVLSFKLSSSVKINTIIWMQPGHLIVIISLLSICEMLVIENYFYLAAEYKQLYIFIFVYFWRKLSTVIFIVLCYLNLWNVLTIFVGDIVEK